MKLLPAILISVLSSDICAQSQVLNDSVSVYKKVLDSLLADEKVISTTAGAVVYADIYGNYDEMRRRDDSLMESEGSLFVMWVETEQYRRSIATILRENKIAFDTITPENAVRTGQLDLSNVLYSRQFIKASKAPLGYSYFENFFKEKRAVQLSELLFVKGLNVAIVKTKIEKRNNKGECYEMIVLRKEQNEWKVLGRTKVTVPLK